MGSLWSCCTEHGAQHSGAILLLRDKPGAGFGGVTPCGVPEQQDVWSGSPQNGEGEVWVARKNSFHPRIEGRFLPPNPQDFTAVKAQGGIKPCP